MGAKKFLVSHHFFHTVIFSISDEQLYILAIKWKCLTTFFSLCNHLYIRETRIVNIIFAAPHGGSSRREKRWKKHEYYILKTQTDVEYTQMHVP